MNDIVIFQPKSIPRSFWTLGRKPTIFTGKDGIVQPVELKLSNPTVVRPVNKMCLLKEKDDFSCDIVYIKTWACVLAHGFMITWAGALALKSSDLVHSTLLT